MHILLRSLTVAELLGHTVYISNTYNIPS